MKIYTLNDLRPLLDKAAILTAVREALIAHARGEVQSPMPGHLLFTEAKGDCHIKYGQIIGSPTFAIKVATGFYDNGAQGLPVNNGLVMVFNAHTGAPLSLFQDEGWLTAWRTAAATALAAHTLAPRADAKIGIIGTGLQGQLAAEWIAHLMPQAQFSIYGRELHRTAKIAANLGIAVAVSVEELLEYCDIIITATPSAKPLFDAAHARPNMHFVGVGADGPEKQELPEALFARATSIYTDDHAQCLQLSDFGRAVRAGVIAESAALSFGDLLAHPKINRTADVITIIDLTGLAAQDIAIANLFTQKLARHRT
jgi:ornithine cyclodeaminase